MTGSGLILISTGMIYILLYIFSQFKEINFKTREDYLRFCEGKSVCDGVGL